MYHLHIIILWLGCGLHLIWSSNLWSIHQNRLGFSYGHSHGFAITQALIVRTGNEEEIKFFSDEESLRDFSNENRDLNLFTHESKDDEGAGANGGKPFADNCPSKSYCNRYEGGPTFVVPSANDSA